MTASRRSETETMLQHWREAVPNDRLAHLVRDAARALVRSLSVRLAEHHVSFGHWSFLRVLWEGDGLTQRQLSVRAGVMEPTTFSAIKTMERLGYVARRQHGGDRKKVYIYLTRKGRSLKERLVPLAEDVNRIAVKGVAPEHLAITRTALLAMIENVAQDESVSAKPMPSTRVIAKLARSRERR
jgi:MarR family transcriptional regulator, organic hydroperoxide resistance regulator